VGSYEDKNIVQQWLAKSLFSTTTVISADKKTERAN
jgi:hypothetical protein